MESEYLTYTLPISIAGAAIFAFGVTTALCVGAQRFCSAHPVFEDVFSVDLHHVLLFALLIYQHARRYILLTRFACTLWFA